MSKKMSIVTKGGRYVVVYITPTFFYSGQSLSDGKDQSFSAKVWNFGTTFLNSLAIICMVMYSLHTYTYWVFWVPFRLAMELKQTCRLGYNCFCTLNFISFNTKNVSRNTLVPEIFDVTHIFFDHHPHFFT